MAKDNDHDDDDDTEVMVIRGKGARDFLAGVGGADDDDDDDGLEDDERAMLDRLLAKKTGKTSKKAPAKRSYFKK